MGRGDLLHPIKKVTVPVRLIPTMAAPPPTLAVSVSGWPKTGAGTDAARARVVAACLMVRAKVALDAEA